MNYDNAVLVIFVAASMITTKNIKLHRPIVPAPVHGRCKDDVLLYVLDDGSILGGYLPLN
jgi:hypothetical protein